MDKTVVIAGVSGAGASSALNALADIGYYAVDNLPVVLLKDFIELAKASPRKYKYSAVLPEIKDPASLGQFLSIREQLGVGKFHLLFLDASNEVITKRYSETRRPHPIFDSAKDQTIVDAIQRERSFLIACKEVANQVIDTSTMTVHDLRRELSSFKGITENDNRIFRVNFVSFGYKYGIPLDCDLIIDVRFLPNPHFQPQLTQKTGLDSEVREFVLGQTEAKEFIERYVSLLEFLLPKYIFEGKAYLNIGIGCTGGRHRSVTLAEELKSRITLAKDSTTKAKISVQHRDVKR